MRGEREGEREGMNEVEYIGWKERNWKDGWDQNSLHEVSFKKQNYNMTQLYTLVNTKGSCMTNHKTSFVPLFIAEIFAIDRKWDQRKCQITKM